MKSWPQSVTVVGAGVMGVQIAALLSAVGKRVFLLDVDEDGTSVGSKAQNAISSLDSKKSPFYLPDHAQSIVCGAISDLSSFTEVDWIIEAVVEDLDVKKKVLAKIDNEGVDLPIITSNTSGLSISKLLEGRSENFSRQFFGVHFFNPPRQMRLVELISTPQTDLNCVSKVSEFLNSDLGKVVVQARDTPNFIANRLGVFSIYSLIHLMEKYNITVPEMDALSGKLLGRPSSATLRLCDLIGIDTLHFVAQTSLMSETSELGIKSLQTPKCIKKMLAKGLLGIKSGEGFYRKNGSSILALNLHSMEYEPIEAVNLHGLDNKRPAVANNFTDVWDNTGKWGPILRQHLSELLFYTAIHSESISESFYAIDQAMKYGFNWELGPFEIWDALGRDRIEEAMKISNSQTIGWLKILNKHASDGKIYQGVEINKVFSPSSKSWERVSGPNNNAKMLNANTTVFNKDGGDLFDVGQGVGVITLKGKLNALGIASLEAIHKALSYSDFRAFVLCGQGDNFSAGANLRYILDLCDQGEKSLEQFLLEFQHTTQKIRNSPIPIIASVHGLCLGGGCEFSLAAHSRIFSSEARVGLVESGVGLVPSGGGILHRVERIAAGADLLDEFKILFMGMPSQNAFSARKSGYLLEEDGIQIGSQNPLANAIKKASIVKQSDTSRTAASSVKVTGASGSDMIIKWLENQFEDKVITEHDMIVGRAISSVVCGGSGPERKVSHDEILTGERDAFRMLAKTEKTRERIAHTLKTGKQLRN